MNNIPVKVIRAAVRQHPEVLPLLSVEARGLLKAAGGYPGVRTEYYTAVYDAVYDYLTGNRPVTGFVNSVKRAFTEAQAETMEIAYTEAGGELPFDDETSAWLVSTQQVEFGHIEDLFTRLKVEWEGLDPDTEATHRADGYTSNLDGIFNETKLRGAKNQSVTWILGSAEKHCKTCASLDGKRHRISWFIERDYIPRKNGAAMDCGGYNCDCSLVTNNGEEITL